MPWSGLGLNYGSNSRAVAYLDADLRLFRKLGITKLRFNNVDYADTAGIAFWRTVAANSCVMGFARVIHGITAGTTQITASTWQAFANAVLDEAKWAYNNGNANLWLEIGNEEELHHDGSITDAQVRTNLRTLAASVKSLYPTLTVCYCASNVPGEMDAWISEGRGSIDYLGFNIYDSPTTLVTDVSKLYTAFGTRGFISEWNRQNSFSQTTGDQNDAIINSQLLAIIKSSGITDAYFFSYYYPSTQYGVLRVDGTYTMSWCAIQEARCNCWPGTSSLQRDQITRTAMPVRSPISRN